MTTTTYTVNVNGLTNTTSVSSTPYTISGSNGWQTSPSTFFNGTKAVMTIPYGEDKVVLDEKATLDVRGTIKVNGLDLEERLKIIERVLGIPERDISMESKYPSLKKKFDDYINSLEKYRTFERIKGDSNETT